MGFKEKKFNKAKFAPRTLEIEVPELAEFFGKGEEPLWKIRNLSGDELRKVDSAGDMVGKLGGLIDLLAKGESATAAKQLLGLAGELESDTNKNIEALLLGSLEPQIERKTAVRLFKERPVQAAMLANAIFVISGLGSELGK